ncbi:hypothetical protein [Cyclobacterium jeungdonense]|uniref:Uncharacterized protein n=1 Tax=Cyclobacterium jeungdonense TaxID=708087 RepID=A0ABT8C2P6_9BACT|nr:hypothetical protein [Cyclobacterium jeungdonense]MDN3686586.1 hypothetical protein [Cyclobacterium jeungdonense]
MKGIIIAIAFMTVASFSYAQDKSDLKGPAAKNYKPWMKKDKADPKKVYTLSETEKLQGPAAKNKKSWKSDDKNFKEVKLVSTKPRVTGPKAKNAKPWNN